MKVKRILIILLALTAILAVTPVLAQWVTTGEPTKITVRDPILWEEDASSPSPGKTTIDPQGSVVRQIKVTNLSGTSAYTITPNLQVTYFPNPEQQFGLDARGPVPDKAEFAWAKHVVGIIQVPARDIISLKPEGSIVIAPKTSLTITFILYFTGSAWPGEYEMSPSFERSEVPGKG